MVLVYKEFDVGAIVRVVETPYKKCPFDWVSGMNQYCSMEAEIVAKFWSESAETYSYHINIDDGLFMWCGNCFDPAQEEVPISNEDFEKILFA